MKNYLIKIFQTSVLMLIATATAFGQASKKEETIETPAGTIKVVSLAEGLNHPWGMVFLPDGRLLVTEREGELRILDKENSLSEPLKGVPSVFAQGQGGLLDVALHPEFEDNNMVYLSFSEPGSGNTAGTSLGRGVLEGDSIENFEVIFQQEPKIDGPNHFGGRIEFTDDNKLFLTMGERFQFDPAQDISNHLGTIVRLNLDGSIPSDNPFVTDPKAKGEIWSYGHRNVESAAIDPNTGKLWIVEMGPLGGDELNQPEGGKNYGWPVVSWGKNYDGTDIPDPPTHPEFADAVMQWTPVISPSGMEFYSGKMFPDWQGHALVGGLSSQAIIIVEITDENTAEEVLRIPMGERIRDVDEAPDGSIYVLTDNENGSVWKLTLMK